MSREQDDADRFAVRAWVGGGTLVGAALGLFVSPRLLWSARHYGVDPHSFGPAAVVIAVGAALGGFLTWRSMRRR